MLRLCGVFLIAGCALVGLSAFADDKGFVRIAPDEVQWKDLPNGRLWANPPRRVSMCSE